MRFGSDVSVTRYSAAIERVQELAPFLSFDHDPFPVIVDGRIKYVVDAYEELGRQFPELAAEIWVAASR